MPITGGDEERKLLTQLVAHYDAPAYVRRGRQVEAAFDHLLERCRRQRDEWLGMVRIRLGTLLALAGDLDRLRALLDSDDALSILQRLHAELNPQLRVAVRPTTSARVLRRALRELAASIDAFNRRWQMYLSTLDLTAVNELREGYNRYYVLEKECALRSARLARQGFHKLEPLTAAELAERLPPLPVP
jgi:hypothetical protein